MLGTYCGGFAWKDLEWQGFYYGIASVLMDMVEYTHGFMLYV